MGISRSTYVFYGVLVGKSCNDHNEPYTYDLWQQFTEKFGENTEFVANDVRWFTAGKYDANDMYLVIDPDGFDSKEVKPDRFRVLPAPVDSSWGLKLWRAARDLGLEILEGPAWFVVADES